GPQGPQGDKGLGQGGRAPLRPPPFRPTVGARQRAPVGPPPGPANALRLTLGRAEPESREGDPLPPASLALYFLPRVAADALRPDGSPRDTGVVPPGPPARRLVAGRAGALPRPARLRGDRRRR